MGWPNAVALVAFFAFLSVLAWALNRQDKR